MYVKHYRLLEKVTINASRYSNDVRRPLPARRRLAGAAATSSILLNAVLCTGSAWYVRGSCCELVTAVAMCSHIPAKMSVIGSKYAHPDRGHARERRLLFPIPLSLDLENYEGSNIKFFAGGDAPKSPPSLFLK